MDRPMPSGNTGPAWHALATAEVIELLDTSADGLTTAEAAARRRRYGPNAIPEEPPSPGWVVLLRQFASPLITVLLVAAAITVVMGEYLDTAMIALALSLNAVIGFAQERRASGAVRALMRLVVSQSRVVRDGDERDVKSVDLVPGDLVVLEPGARVPADLRLTSATELAIDESLLTGESLPNDKDIAPVSERTLVADRRSMAFTGTIVASGRGRGYVVATGADTELGAIAGLVQRETAAELPLHARMRVFAQLVVGAVLLAAAVTIVSGVAMGRPASELLHIAVAMAVSAVPEGLPVAVTVTLAVGVSRMARRHAVLRQLPALETLGSTTVIASDKTGTLTENRMEVQTLWCDGQFVDLAAVDHPNTCPAVADPAGTKPAGTNPVGLELPGRTPPTLALVLAAGVLANEARLTRSANGVSTVGDPTDVALLAAALRAGIDPAELQDRYTTLVDIPFAASRRYAASVRDVDSTPVLFAKGSPERIVQLCSSMLTAAGPVPLDAAAVHVATRTLAARGLRVLAMAYRPLSPSTDWRAPEPDGTVHDPDDLVLVGLQGMMDPPRAGVREAIAACHEAGIRVVMITGDHAITARAIAGTLGIIDPTDPDAGVAIGAEIAALDDEQLGEVVRNTSVFARAAPEDKLRIVRALEADGDVVAVTGDGVNDAPALRAAAIGVAMGRSGTDVAREASDMVLSDDEFVSIVAAVEEGRIAFANIRKVSFFLVSTAAAETLAIMMTVWLGWPLLLVAAQILWLNLVTNGVQDLALAFEPGSPDALKRPPSPRREGIFSPVMWVRTALVGTVMAAGALLMFRWELDRGGSLEHARTVALTTLVIFNVFQAGNARAERRSLFTLSPLSNRFLLLSTLAAVGIHVAALYLPPTQHLLSVEPISLDAWVRAAAVATSVLVTVELHKAFHRRSDNGAGPALSGHASGTAPTIARARRSA